MGLAMVALAATAGLMVAIVARGAPSKPMPIASASGALHLTNSRSGQTILTAAGMAPGDTISGHVTLGNWGDMPGAFSVAQRLQSETAGLGGGHIYDRLALTIHRAGEAAPVYDGPLAGMASASLGSFAAGLSRTYDFQVSYPDDGSDPNPYQGSAATVAYEWSLTSGRGGGTTTVCRATKRKRHTRAAQEAKKKKGKKCKRRKRRRH